MLSTIAIAVFTCLSLTCLSDVAAAQTWTRTPVTRSSSYPSNAVIVPSTTSTAATVCPKCGRIHGSTTTSPITNGGRVVGGQNPGRQVSYSAPMESSGPTVTNATASTTISSPSSASTPRLQGTYDSGSGAQNVLDVLNAQRARQGLRRLRFDPALQAVARRRARIMARSGTKSHPPGSFAPGRYEGVGWSSSFSPRGVHACYTSNPNMSAAGAAMVTGRDGVYFCVVYR